VSGGLATGEQLAALARRARASGRLGIDTEFIGEGRYRTLLCLIQVVVQDAAGIEVLVLDPLDEQLDLAPLAALLPDPAIEIIVHAGRQDVALLRRHLRCEVGALFDTQVAAGFAGLSAQAGYDTLLREVLDVRVHKSASYTRWDKRPLTAEQIGYAREDVLHLLELAAALQGSLRETGRLEWAREECVALEHSSDERDPDALFARLPRINSLRPGARAIARELVEWREDVAARQDRPVSTVLNDSALVELAKRQPSSFDELEAVRGVNQGSLRRRGEELLAAIDRGRQRPPIAAERSPFEAASPFDAPLIALSEALVRGRAAEAGMAYELIAARADLARIVARNRSGADEADVRTLQGWRRELVGNELLELLAGRLTLAVSGDGRLVVTNSHR
jgi:ribonuclease D